MKGMNHLHKCEGCGSEDAMMAHCLSCTRRLCRRCVSCAGQCAECATKRELPAVMCALCRNAEDKMQRCIICREAICSGCVLCKYSNRPITIVCRGCSKLSPIMAACGRCAEIITDKETAYYCEVCADPLCGNCLSASFECGVLKCRTCCPTPVRLLNDRPTRTMLDDEVRALAIPAQPTPLPAFSKYHHLRNRELLGQGGQGLVFKCVTCDGEIVVSKEMTFADNDRTLFLARLRQAEKMRKLSHKHLIKYLDVIGSENPLKIAVIMPYYSEGDLFRFIKRQRGPIGEHKLCSIILQIASALDYLHTLNPPLVHRDIKPDNVLLLNREQVLLMDLDLCRSYDAQPSTSARVLQEQKEASPTFEYRAPELAHSAGSVKSDVFSLGVVAFVLATLPEFAVLQNDSGTTTVLNDSDWTRNSLALAIRRDIQRHTRNYSDELIMLIINMLRHRPAERPKAMEVRVQLSKIMERRLLEQGG